jgi:hypothetical protein
MPKGNYGETIPCDVSSKMVCCNINYNHSQNLLLPFRPLHSLKNLWTASLIIGTGESTMRLPLLKIKEVWERAGLFLLPVSNSDPIIGRGFIGELT